MENYEYYLKFLPWIIVGLGAAPLVGSLIALVVTGTLMGILDLPNKIVRTVKQLVSNLKARKIHKSGFRLSAEIVVATLGTFIGAKGLGTTTYEVTGSWHVTALVIFICVLGLAIIILRQIKVFNDAWIKPRPLWNWLFAGLIAPIGLLIMLIPDQPKFKVGQAIKAYGSGDSPGPYYGEVVTVRSGSPGNFEYLVNLPGTQHWEPEHRLYPANDK